MAGWRSWLGLPDDEPQQQPDDPVQRTLDVLGGGGSSQPSFAPEDYSTSAIMPPALPQPAITAPFQDTYQPEPAPAPAAAPSPSPFDLPGVPSYRPQAAQVTAEQAPSRDVLAPIAEGLRRGYEAAEPYLTGPVRTSIADDPGRALGELAGSPLLRPTLPLIGDRLGIAGAPLAPLAGYLQTEQAFQEPIAEAATSDLPETPLGALPFSTRDVGRYVVQGALSPESYLGVPAAAAEGQLARGLAEAAPIVGEALGATGLARAGLGVARAVPGAVRELPETLGRARGAVSDWLAGNAERLAAADARMAGDPAYSATLIAPEGSPVRTRKVAGMEPTHLAADELPAFERAADDIAAGSLGPGSPEALDPAHPVEWHDLTVRINNGGQYDGDHPVSLPFFRTRAGELIPLEPSEVGPVGSPVNSAYNKAVSAAGGRKGFPYGLWRAPDRTLHPFDSPSEVVAMHHLEQLKQEGRIREWWSQANLPPELDLANIPYISTNRDKGGLKTYVPDLVYRDNDGRLRVLEVKPAKVIAAAEEYGRKAGEVTGKMGWDVAKKAAGIVGALADRGVGYELFLQRDAVGSGRIPLGPNRAGAGNRTRRLDLIPGVDPRDRPKMRRKTIAPEESSPGNAVAGAIRLVSDKALEEADRLRALGMPDAERLQRLTRLTRDDVLLTGNQLGRTHGQTRNMQVGGTADLPSYFKGRGSLSLDELDEFDPDLGQILRGVEEDGATLGGLSVHEHTLPDGSTVPRLTFDADGDPQAAIRAAARIGEHYGQGRARAGFAYRDTEGPHRIAATDLASPGGGTPEGAADLVNRVIRAVTGGADDAPRLAPRYTSDRLLEGFDVLGRGADGTVHTDQELQIALHRLEDELAREGLGAASGPIERAEISHFAGGVHERGHAVGTEAGLRRAEQALGRRPITAEEALAEQAERRRAAAGRRGAGGAAEADADAAAGAGVGRPGAIDEVDDLGDLDDGFDDLDAGVTLIGPLPRGLGRAPRPPEGALDRLNQAAGRVVPTAGQSLAGSVSGAYLGAAAPAETEEERRQNAIRGAALGAVAGPVASRGIGAIQRAAGARSEGALATLGAVPGRGGPQNLGSGFLARFPGAAQAVAAAQQRAAAMAARGVQPLGPLEWGRKLAAQIGYSSMIGPTTFTASMLGGPLEAAWSLPKQLAGAALPARMGGRAAPAEALAIGRGALQGLAQTGEAVVDALRGQGRYAPTPGHEPLSAVTVNPIGHAVATGLEAGGRFWSGVPDAIYGTIGRSIGEHRAAAEAATNAGLTGAAWRQHVDDLLADAAAVKSGQLPTMSGTQDVLAAGERAGKRSTYQDELGTIGQNVKDLATLAVVPDGKGGRKPVPLLGNTIAPFFNTPWNMEMRLAEKVPGLGAAMNTQRGFDKAYDQVVGTALVAGMAGYAAAGNITGAGPDDPEQKKMLAAQGWRPYSTNVGGYYIPNRVLGEYGPLLNAVGDFHDALVYSKDRDPAGVAGSYGARIGKQMQERVWLQGLSELLGALDAGQQGGLGAGAERYVAGLATRMVPYGATVRTALASQDPWLRTTDRGPQTTVAGRVGQQIQRGLGLGQGVPALGIEPLPIEQDILGRPQPNPQQGAAALAARVGTERPEPISRAYLDAGVDIGGPPTALGGIALTPAQQRRWNTARGQALTAARAEVLGARGLPKAERQAELRRILSEAAASARDAVEPTITPRQRAEAERKAS